MTGRVLFAFRHFPLERLHPLAAKTSAAAECAAVGGRFWAMHDRLFQSPSQLTLPKVMGFAEALGLDPSRYGACVNQDTMAAKIREDIESARAVGVAGTPSFLVGLVQPDGRVKVTKRIVGAAPYQRFKEILDEVENNLATR